MHDREYFLTTSLSYKLQAARRELADFRSGEVCRKMRADYEGIIREQNLTIKKLQKEYEKEVEKLKKTITELLDMIVSLKNRNAELDEKRKKALSDYSFTSQ